MSFSFLTFSVTIALLTGCGQSEFSLSQSQRTAKKEAPATSDDASIQTNNTVPTQSNADAAPEPAPLPVLAPVPVIGSYLVGELFDPSRGPVQEGEVTLEEGGRDFMTVRVDGEGRFRLPVSNLAATTALRVTLNSGVAKLTVDQKVQNEMSQSLEVENRKPQVLFQLKVIRQSAGIRLDSQVIVPPELDRTRPIMSFNTREVAGAIEVSIRASDAQSGLAPQAYSYDGGASWTDSATKLLPAGTTITVGLIRVRDRANNQSQNNVTILL